MFYVVHRIYHAIPTLWRFHAIHHSSADLDWLATYRVHPVDQIINATAIALPALLFGFSPLAFAIYAAFYQWHSILLHANIRASFGPLAAVITTPRFHRWHHANELEAYDRNFGGQLVIWDRLFGTRYEPAREPVAFGLDQPPAETFFAHIVSPFRSSNG
jgi:sterol desaturase/sphingolipid hydroxylase (fatty acid hydroxylase superfamily)